MLNNKYCIKVESHSSASETHHTDTSSNSSSPPLPTHSPHSCNYTHPPQNEISP